MRFDLQSFTAQCLEALQHDKPQETISELMRNVLDTPDTVLKALGKPDRAKLERLYVSDSLTIANVVWAPKMTLHPHNHNMWAVIGVYCGREDNIFWRRIKNDNTGKIEAAGAKSIAAGEVAGLGKNLIHSVTNPTGQFTGAIHIYGGNFFEKERSEWDPMALSERPYDVEATLNLFEAENNLLSVRKNQGQTTDF